MLKIQCIGLLSDLRLCPTAISRALFHQCRFMVRVAIGFGVKLRGRVQISYMHVVQSMFVVMNFVSFIWKVPWSLEHFCRTMLGTIASCRRHERYHFISNQLFLCLSLGDTMVRREMIR